MAKDTTAKYWADTEVLETFMGHIYSKISTYIKKQLNGITKNMSDAQSAYDNYSSSIYMTKTNSIAEVQQTAASTIAEVQQTAETCDASMNEWRDMIDEYMAGLNEAVLTQSQYDELIALGVTTDAQGIHHFYFSSTDVTTITTDGELEKTDGTTTITWEYDSQTGTVSSTEYTAPLTSFVNGQTTTYYIIEETT